MWILVLFSFALCHGTLAEVDCDYYSGCKRPTMFSYVPSEISEFNMLCPELPAFMRCLKGLEEHCPKNSYAFSSDEEYDQMLGVYSDLCEEGTLFNTVATENLKCLNETFTQTSCPEKMKAVTGPYRSPMHESEDEDDYTLPIEIMCLQNILESNCISADIGENCGQASLDATLEFLRRIDYIGDTCGKQNAKILLKGLAAFDLDERQKEILIATLSEIIISAKD